MKSLGLLAAGTVGTLLVVLGAMWLSGSGRHPAGAGNRSLSRGGGEPVSRDRRPKTTRPARRATDSQRERAVANALERIDDWAAVARSRVRRQAAFQLALAAEAHSHGRREEAVACYDRILTREPEHFEALRGKAAVLTELARFRGAAACYRRAVAAEPDDLKVRFNFAVTLSRLSMFGEAAEQYRQIIKRRPDHERALYNLAVIAQREGKLSEAVELWQRVTQLSPRLASVWFHQGVALLELGRSADAVRCFQEAARLEPKRADVHTNLALALQADGKVAQARDAFERALQIQSDFLPAINGLAGLCWECFRRDSSRTGDRGQAIALCKRSLAIKADQPEIEQLLARMTGQPSARGAGASSTPAGR